MKPLAIETRDTTALEDIGRASVRIVHDLKNQLNGLKLYATFLRGRMAKDDRPADERETVSKLISGIERAASDLTILVRYGRPIELNRRPGVSLRKILDSAVNEGGVADPALLEMDDGPLEGEFDVAALTEALQAILSAARRARSLENGGHLSIRAGLNQDSSNVIIEFPNVKLGSTKELMETGIDGEGVRLALAARIIEGHGGSIEQKLDALSLSLPLGKKR